MKHKHYDTIIAWANGAKIQYKNYLDSWVTTPTPNFSEDTEYRVIKETKKVKKMVKVEGWVNVYSDMFIGDLYQTQEDAEKYRVSIPHKTIFISEEIEVEE